MDIKSILNKIEDCKKDLQKKELLKNFKYQIANIKNKKAYEQIVKIDFKKILKKLYQSKEFDIFLEISTSIIEHLYTLTEAYRKIYQEKILNLILPKNITNEELLKIHFDYFLIATNHLEDIYNIKKKQYLIYYLFFNIFLILKLDLQIIDSFIKLEKYITKYQYEIIIYIFTIYSFINKSDDFPEQMIILKKIIDFCKFDFSNDNKFYFRNYDLMKNIIIMLLLYTPFKQEILINLYNADPNYFMSMIQNIIIYLGNDLLGNNNNNNNRFNIIYNTDLIDINNFFEEDFNKEFDFEEIKSNDNEISNYFSNKEYFINKYNKFIEKINIKAILVKNRYEIYKGLLWTLSSIILKNYYLPNDSSNDIFNENKNHSTRLFNSLISIFQFINPYNQKIFSKQYLELVKSLIKEVQNFEEWSYILDILDKCSGIITIKNNQKKEITEKEFKNEINLLNEIFTIILDIYNKNELFFCDMENLSLIMHKFNQFLQNDSLLCFYINIYLTTKHKNKKYNEKPNCFMDDLYFNFINNIEIIFFNVFSLRPNVFPKTKNYLLELIRVNYLYDKKININKDDNFISKQIIIEKVLEKYLENVFISSGNTKENYSFFNFFLMDILCQTNNINFLNQILALLIFNNNESIDKSLYNKFVSSIISDLFENLINNYSKCNLFKEKLSFLINFFFEENNMNDENIFKLGLTILKNFIVNNRYEIIFVKNIKTLNNIDFNNKHSFLVIDFLYNRIPSNESYYAPYVVFPHVNLFKSINMNLENIINKPPIFESILEFYYFCLSKNFLFLKNVNINPLLKVVFYEKELTKVSSSKRITNYLIKILTLLPYQLNYDIDFNSSKKIELQIKNNSILNDDIQLNIDPKYKISIINFLINFWKNLNGIISQTLNKIFSDEQLSQTIFNKQNKNKNIKYNEKSIKTSIHNLLNKGKSYLWCEELNLYSQFEYLYDCIKLLKIYLMSCSNELLSQNKNNLNEKQNKAITKNKTLFSSLKTAFQNIFIEIINSINFKYFNKKYSYFILSFLYEIKEILTQFISEELTLEIKKGIKRKSFSYTNVKEQINKLMAIEEQKKLNEKENKGIYIIYKTIFISLFLSWSYEDRINSSFDKYFGLNYNSKFVLKDKSIVLKKFYEQNKHFDEGLQMLMEHLSDILNLYLMQNIPEKNINILINTLDEIFLEKKTYREYYFYKMAEWCLKIRKNRDAININYKNIFDMNFLNNINNNNPEDEYIGQKILKNSYVFYGNNSLIIINPINTTKCCFSLRNPICNMNLIFDTNVPIISDILNKHESSDDNEEEEEEEDDNEDSFEIKKDKDKEDNSYLSGESSDSKNKKNEGNKIFEFDEGNDEGMKNPKKNSDKKINSYLDFNSNKYDLTKSKEYEDKINERNKNVYPIRRKRSNTDLGDRYRKSLLLAENKKKMKNCLKIFSILTELTDYKIEQYKWFDITKNNNLYNMTKFVQHLDLLPLYFIHNCAIIYYSKNKESNSNNLNNIASYMYFIQKLGLLYNYNDLYPDINQKNNNYSINNSEKYIIINQDSFSRINFKVLNLYEKNENKLLKENNIIIIWKENKEEYPIPNPKNFQDKLKIFFIMTKISERLYKIQRKYNSIKKEEINYIIDELFLNEFIIDIENKGSIQMIINIIKFIDILIKKDIGNIERNNNKGDFMGNNKENKENIEKNEKNIDKNIVLDKQNKKMNDDYKNLVDNSENNLNSSINYINENEIMNKNESELKRRYQLMSKL